jgi:hypothetical protein
VPLGMANNVHFGCFPFLGIKSSFFIFLAPKMGSFVKHLPNICFINVPTHFYKLLYHILCTIHKLFAWESFIDTPQEIDKILSIQLEAGQI